MDDLLSYIIVFLLAATPFFEMVPIIPIGVVWGLELIPVSILALLGNVSTVLLVVLMMNRINNWLQRRRERREQHGKAISSKRQERAKRIWQKYGLIGLAFISPIFIGSHLGVVMAMSLGGSKKLTTIYMVGSLIFWCVVTIIATHLGVEIFSFFS